MTSPPADFGKRKPATPAVTSPPVKRSHHVALLMMGTFAVGGTAYAVMPRENCQPASPAAVAGPSPPISGMTAQPSPTPATACGSRYSGSGGHGGGSGSWWSHSNFYGGSSSSGSSAGAGSTTTTRGGFGSFAHLFSGGG